MRALSIRQPYAELILRGIKTIEYRSRPTKIIGERFYIYASRKWAGVNGHDAAGIAEGEAPTGVIVGTAIIRKCIKNCDGYEWHLSGVKRMKRPRKVKGQPQPVWFRPW
jgi:predicted transcriptional regulator